MKLLIDGLHISHNASGMEANIRVLLTRNSGSHSSLDVNGFGFPVLSGNIREDACSRTAYFIRHTAYGIVPYVRHCGVCTVQ